MPVENVWKTYFEALASNDESASDAQRTLEDPKHTIFFKWQPNRSNCPELETIVEELIKLAPSGWRAAMRQLYVGRILKGDANAEAVAFRTAGVVELNFGFTMASMIYSALYCQYFEAIRTAFFDVDLGMDDNETLAMILEELERNAFEPILVADGLRAGWANTGVVATHPALTELPQRRSEESHQLLVTGVEAFAIAHEFSHYMLGHVGRMSSEAAKLSLHIDRWITRAGLDDDLDELSPGQLDEIKADVGAFLLISGELCSEVTHTRIYRATFGSVVALVALAHVNDTWIDVDGSHPGFLDRFNAIRRIVETMTSDMPKGESGDHPLGLLGQLRGFVQVVLQFWISRHVDGEQPPSFIALLNGLAELQTELEEALKNSDSK